MATEYDQASTEAAMRAHVESLGLNAEASTTVSNVYRTANAVRNHLTTTVLRPNDLTWTGWVVLWVVWVFGGLESRHAAESASISKGTLTGVVRTLEARGWMRRRVDEVDRRLLHLELTPAGLRLMQRVAPQFNAAEAQVMAGLKPRTAQTMRAGLRTVIGTVEALDAVEAADTGRNSEHRARA